MIPVLPFDKIMTYDVLVVVASAFEKDDDDEGKHYDSLTSAPGKDDKGEDVAASAPPRDTCADIYRSMLPNFNWKGLNTFQKSCKEDPVPDPWLLMAVKAAVNFLYLVYGYKFLSVCMPPPDNARAEYEEALRRYETYHRRRDIPLLVERACYFIKHSGGQSAHRDATIHG